VVSACVYYATGKRRAIVSASHPTESVVAGAAEGGVVWVGGCALATVDRAIYAQRNPRISFVSSGHVLARRAGILVYGTGVYGRLYCVMLGLGSVFVSVSTARAATVLNGTFLPLRSYRFGASGPFGL